MKTGFAGHSDLEATSTGNETRFSSTRPFCHRASPREEIDAISNRGASVEVAAGKVANEAADVLVVRMQPRRTGIQCDRSTSEAPSPAIWP
jgi:hypothetical protein